MISVKEAKYIIRDNIHLLEPKRLPLSEAFGKLLQEDIFSPINLPPFHQSSVDGYAFCFEEWKKNNQLIIEGEVQAGSASNSIITNNTAVRIFTGAPLPQGADTVVMQEKTIAQNGLLIIQDENIQKGNNARSEGAEMTKGSLALQKGSMLHTGAVAFIAGMGIHEVIAIPNPSVSIIVTGNELIQPGNDLPDGKIFDSNSFTLISALHTQKIFDIEVVHASDNLDDLTQALKTSLDKSDLILITGGVSVGDYDFVVSAAERCGVEKLFHRIKQKPGKPLYFGKKDQKIIFGLPGNPASVLTCFYEYVLLALEKMTGRKHTLKNICCKITNEFKKPAGLTHFLKGWMEGTEVKILEGQESYKLSSFAKANCLIVVEEETTEVKKGDEIEVHILH